MGVLVVLGQDVKCLDVSGDSADSRVPASVESKAQ